MNNNNNNNNNEVETLKNDWDSIYSNKDTASRYCTTSGVIR